MKPNMRWVFFGFSGRLARLPFLLANLFVAAIGCVILVQFSLSLEESTRQGAWALLFFAYVVVSIWSSLALGVKRLHDIGFPGPLSVTLLIPFFNFAVFIALCAWPGAIGANAFGQETNRPDS